MVTITLSHEEEPVVTDVKEPIPSDNIEETADASEAEAPVPETPATPVKQPITDEDVRTAYKFAGNLINDLEYDDPDADSDVALQIAIKRIANACAVYIAEVHGTDALSKDAIFALMKEESHYDPATGVSEFAKKITEDLPYTKKYYGMFSKLPKETKDEALSRVFKMPGFAPETEEIPETQVASDRTEQEYPGIHEDHESVDNSTGDDFAVAKEPEVPVYEEVIPQKSHEEIPTVKPISAFNFFKVPTDEEDEAHPMHEEKKQNLFQAAAPADEGDDEVADIPQVKPVEKPMRKDSFFSADDEDDDEGPIAINARQPEAKAHVDTTFALALYACCDELPKKPNRVQDAAKLLLEACVLQQKEQTGLDMPSIGNMVKELEGGIEELDRAFVLSEAQESAKQYRKFQRFDDETKAEAIQSVVDGLQKML